MGVAVDDGQASGGAGSSGSNTRRTTGEVILIPGVDRVTAALNSLVDLAEVRGDVSPAHPQLPELMAHAAGEARALGLQPEEFMILLKSSWRARSTPARAQQVDHGEDQLTGLVTLCIKAYFAPSTRS
jgi:hypothetical protein